MRKGVGILFRCVLLIVIVMATALSFPGAKPAMAGTGPVPGAADRDTGYGNMPLLFIPNAGQLDEQVVYAVQGRNKSVLFTTEGLTFVLKEPVKAPPAGRRSLLRKIGPEALEQPLRVRWVVKLDFVGARRDVRPESLEAAGTVVSFFKGRPEEWKAGLQTSSKIIYRDLWPGIDLVYYGTVNRLKYEFTVHPGADPGLIRLAYRGADRVDITREGGLEVSTPLGGLQDEAPVAWQERNGERERVRVDYARDEAGDVRTAGLSLVADDAIPAGDGRGPGAHGYGFAVGPYDRSRTLVLDPSMLIYCGYIGGNGADQSTGIAVDREGNAYITGITDSDPATFPVAAGPDLTYSAPSAIFVAKVRADGTGLSYCGYISGGFSVSAGIAVDQAGNAYIAGFTLSLFPLIDDLPVTVGPDLTSNGSVDGFVAKVNAEGTALLYCGYIGGAEVDLIWGIAVDQTGNAYVTGDTDSSQATFPVAVGPDLTFNGEIDAFVAKVKADGTGLAYCGYIGGTDSDAGYAIAVDRSGNAYVTGGTDSSQATFPVAVGPDLSFNGGPMDAFVAKVKADGTALAYCGYIGGSGQDRGEGIAVDPWGNAYVAGGTESDQTTFPVTVGPDLTFNGDLDAFVAKVKADGTALAYCGYIGGSGLDAGYGIAVDWSGNASVTGITRSTAATFPVAVGPGLAYKGGDDAFVAKVKADGTALAYCGYIGGFGNDLGGGIALDPWGNAYVTGITDSDAASFPVTAGPDLSFNGDLDAFVAKIHDITADPADFDGDGAADSTEQGPTGADPAYDGNGDGIPDWQQNNVISIPSPGQNGETRYTTVAVPPGRYLAYLLAPRAADAPPPAGVSFPYGLFSFAIGGIPPGGATTATIHLDGRPPQTYYKYGKTADNPVDHWYEFSYDGETGAEMVGNTVVLHFVDGKRGDHDLKGDGRITDPGGPAAVEHRQALYFPYLAAYSAEGTEIGIINTKRYAATATISYYGENGGLIAAVALPLAPLGKATVSAEGFPPNSASAIVSGDGKLAGYTRYVNSRGQRCAWPAAERLQRFLFVPHTAVDAAWATGLCLFNPSDGAVEVTMAYDSGGSGRLTLGGKSRRFLWLAETEPVSTISSTGPISVMEMFESLTTGGDRAALLLGDRQLPALFVPSILHGSGEFTGIGLNSHRNGIVAITGYDDAGRAEEATFGTQPLGDQGTRGKAAVNLSGLLGETSRWARISGAADIMTPAGTLPLSFQGLALYGTEAAGRLGAVSLNALKFKEGFLGILSGDPEPEVALLNPGGVDAVVEVTAYSATGEALIMNTVRIAAGTLWSAAARELFNGALPSRATHIRIAADADLYGFETLSANGRLETIPILAVD